MAGGAGAPYFPGSAIRPEESLIRFLSDDGTSSGVKNAIGDYSVATGTPTRFSFLNETSGYAILHRMIVVISDGNGAQAAEYGSLGAALTNGFEINVRDENDNEVLSMTDNVVIQTNGDWQELAYDVQLLDWGAGADYIGVRWTFANSGKQIALPSGWNFGMTFSDNLSGLLKHSFMLQGYYS